MEKSKQVIRPVGRSASRLAAIQALYQIKQTQSDSSDVIRQFIEYQFSNDKNYVKVKIDFFRILVESSVRLENDVFQKLEEVLDDDWRIERLQLVMVCILQVAIAEILHDPLISIAVVINEYINVAKFFCTASEVAFVNASLDKVFKKLKGDLP